MKRNKIITGALAAAAAICLSACQREQTPESPTIKVSVTITGGGTAAAETKVASAISADESKINDVQYFIYKNAVLEDYTHPSTASTTAELTATPGTRTIYALVNAPTIDPSTVSGESSLKGMATDLKDYGKDNLIMFGYTTHTLTAGENVPITVSRLASKVIVDKIECDYKYGRADYQPRINGIYLINAAGENTLALSASSPTKWYNKLGHYDPDLDEVLYDAVNKTVSNSASYGTVHTFYTLPNNVADPDHTGTWKPRHTMLVIDVTLNGAQGYYPIELPVLEGNKYYEIKKVTLTKDPNSEPYTEIVQGSATAEITVSDWAIGQVWTEIVL